MSRPVITVRIAFATDPLATTPTWTDVSSYVRSIHTHRGRQYELNRIEAGTANIVLDNRDRRFDPTNASSPYYPNVVPARKINIQATWSGTTYDLYTGYANAWPPDWPAGYDSTVTVPCSDGFGYFANTLLTINLATGDDAGSYITGILSGLSWPSADQSVNTGNSILQPVSVTNQNALQLFQQLVDSENGYLYMGADGKLWFRERHWRLINSGNPNSTGVSGTSTGANGIFGDSGGSELPYLELVPSFDETLVANDIHLTRIGGVEQVAQDATSQTRYFRRSLSQTGLLITTDNETNDAANWRLGQYKDPALRFKRMTIAGPMDDRLWLHALGRDFGERIRVYKRPPGGGAAIAQDCFIEGIEHQISLDNWLTSFDLSPASTQAFWVLDDPVLSVLNSTTRPVY